MKRKLLVLALVLSAGIGVFWVAKKVNLNTRYEVGQAVDSLHHIKVYYNGAVDHVGDRARSPDGYNIGLQYQCVEFVKRYYYLHYHHKMPNSYGHAKEFFNKSLLDGSYNADRGLIQYANPSRQKPQEGDLLVFSGTSFNPYGHVAIVSYVGVDWVEIIQQNPGPFSSSRDTVLLHKGQRTWEIKEKRILGWLRKE